MRACTALCVAITLALAAQAGILRADPGQEGRTERIAGLIRQLGHDEFTKREAATKELEAIGEPALDVLRKAAASSEDPEIRRRAEWIIRALAHRAGKKELAKWEGAWTGDPGVTMTITGERFTSSAPGVGSRNGRISVIEVREKVALVDFLVDEGDVKGQARRAILRLDGDTLQYCVTYNEARPTEFKTGGGNYHIAWKRVAK